MAGTYKGFEVVRKRGWANMSAKVILSILLICLYIAAAGLAVLPLVICFKEHMVTFTGTFNSIEPAGFSVWCGYFQYHNDNNALGVKYGNTYHTLGTIGTASLILGWVSAGLLIVSVLVACFLVLSAICGRAGKSVACFSIPFTVILAGVLIAYYLVLRSQVSALLTQRNPFKWNDSHPNWGWSMSAGCAGAWLVISILACWIPAASYELGTGPYSYQTYEPGQAPQRRGDIEIANHYRNGGMGRTRSARPPKV
ncbi:hypothetical protein WJX84_007715 [Apatococcus fuscideae]|uniref:Pali-domain-containing protein n=1 Tax=Apatococcus fuscideae TaxID=2026836 RepID=A0AAW1TFP5_9CHLO